MPIGHSYPLVPLIMSRRVNMIRMTRNFFGGFDMVKIRAAAARGWIRQSLSCLDFVVTRRICLRQIVCFTPKSSAWKTLPKSGTCTNKDTYLFLQENTNCGRNVAFIHSVNEMCCIGTFHTARVLQTRYPWRYGQQL